MDFMEQHEIVATAGYILDRGFTRVALQFPDELLHASVEVTSLLLSALSERNISHGVKLFVMADTTYGSCCVDEVAAAHVDAQCVIHYGHTCLSQTSRLPVFFVFGRGRIDAYRCSQAIMNFDSNQGQPVVVLFGLQYAHAVEDIRREVDAGRDGGGGARTVVFAEIPRHEMEPVRNSDSCSGLHGSGGCSQGACTPRVCDGGQVSSACSTRSNSNAACVKSPRVASEQDLKQDRAKTAQLAEIIGGLKWYNADNDVLVKDLPSKSRDLMRRFALVERAKEASIVGIVVGTLGVAGYNESIRRVREIVAAAGKKSYTMLMGRPNPAKLANFPECDVFVLVACAQTILLDSKEYLAPLITPFEAELAFVEGKEWTGAFSLELGSLPKPGEEPSYNEAEARTFPSDDDENRESVLSEVSGRALQLRPPVSSLAVASSGRTSTGATSSSEYLALRSYQGLEMHDSEAAQDTSITDSAIAASYEVVEGRTGRAAGYSDEAANM
ncbi:uncharacterized protein [Physcomitrium patens]|uniref:uncharacterized protein isoform X2 n=1 Tax=Physcomitrium patens TaxID=3218 RepID=UPI000D168688|nr:2-(3-amino-3-carboxypropyl)histidine synthase subunit 2-like isoform X2 [Physcomitrium patens]|eukprot:XP_024381857.1 2-(3-amino-3-carboxypropyl)histidine synthase subunit 2-like isoform X2 [Physcomitrella patens]